MIALLQRVNHAQINIAGLSHAAIGRGLLVLIGLEKNDSQDSVSKLLDRIMKYRIFPDAEGRMNLGLSDIGGELLLVSQFTLAAATNSGLRPSFSAAMPPAAAEQLYNWLVDTAQQRYSAEKVKSGIFAADMQITLENDGPVTFTLQG